VAQPLQKGRRLFEVAVDELGQEGLLPANQFQELLQRGLVARTGGGRVLRCKSECIGYALRAYPAICATKRPQGRETCIADGRLRYQHYT
jgi:hypothetical protein